MRRRLATVLFALASSCSQSTTSTPKVLSDDVPVADVPPVPLDGVRSLRITPSDVTLEAGPDHVATQRFAVTGTFADGRTRDVTSSVVFELLPSRVGRLDGATLRTGAQGGGEALVLARPSRGSPIAATAQVHIRWTAADVATGVPADVADRFTRAPMSTDGVARVVYPYDGVMLPPNLSGLEVHAQVQPSSTAALDLWFQNAVTEVHLYRPCVERGGGCVAALDLAALRLVADTNRGLTAPAALRVRTLHRDGHATISAPVSVRFAPEDVAGGIYYWAAAKPANGIYRFDFARGDRAPTPYYTASDAPTDHAGESHPCVGCHALSQDGTRMASVLGGAHIGDVVMLDVERRAPVAQRIERWAQLLTFSPDGARLVGALDGALRVLDANTLDATQPIATGDGRATHPEWSASGNGVAFTLADDQREGIYTRRGSIAWLAVTSSGFGAAQTLAAAVRGENRYYPGVTPDGAWVVFNRSVCPGGIEPGDGVPSTSTSGDHPCDGYDDPSASLWMVDTELPTHRAVELAAINRRGPTDTTDYLTNSWPKVSPFSALWQGRRIFWVTFSSKRDYGLRLVGTHRPQLWMAAVAVPEGETRAALVTDPSFAPFWLPFQDPETGNHIAQWTRTVVVPQ